MADSRPKYERELQNFVALTTDLAAKRLVWESRPYYLEYSTNTACNLRCIMCHQVENPPVVSTPLEMQEPFLDEILESTTIITPSATSEPLLNNLRRLLPILERHGVYMDIITNGVLLTPEVTEQLLPPPTVLGTQPRRTRRRWSLGHPRLMQRRTGDYGDRGRQ